MNDIKEKLQKKKALFNEVLQITELQQNWIEEEDYKRLNNTIRSKDNKIKKIERVNQSLKHLSEDEKIQYKQILEEIDSTMLKIKELDQKNIQRMNELLKITGDKIQQNNLKKKVFTAYSGVKEIQKDGCFIDKFK